MPSYSAADFTAEEFGLITVPAAASSWEKQIVELAWEAQILNYAVASLLLALKFRGLVRALVGK